MICARDGCKADGLWAAKICVPATGHPIDAHQPLSALVGLALCAGHVDDIDPALWVGPGQKMRGLFLAMALGKALPDFSRAFVTRVTTNSDEWRALKSAGRQ